MNKRMKSQKQAAKTSFLSRVAGCTFEVRSKELGYPGGARSRATAPSQLRSQLRSWGVSDASGSPRDSGPGGTMSGRRMS